MTDDFNLFSDAEGDGPVIDPDIALITAYLAAELSPVQIAAVEERLAADDAFRSTVQPILDAWLAPGAVDASRPALPRTAEASGLVDRAEVEAGWQRYRLQARTPNMQSRTATPDRDRLIPQRRRTAKSRMAAVIAVTVVPVFAFAQIVKYVANHPDAPGYTLAQRVTDGGDAKEGRPLNLTKVKQAVPVVDLPPATARTTRTFDAILGVRQTADGRVLINDPVRHQLLRFEPDLSTATVLLDSVPGTSRSYRSSNPNLRDVVGVLDPFLGDSSVFGPAEINALVIDGQGNIVRAIALGTAGPMFLRGPHAWDPAGRLVYLGRARSTMFMATYVRPGEPGQNRGTVSVRSDSVPVVRIVALNRAPASPSGGLQLDRAPTVDTLGFLLLPEDQPPRQAGPVSLQLVGNGGGRLVPVTGPDGAVCIYSAASSDVSSCSNTAKQVVNPLSVVDDWAMLSDGTLAFVRGQDYHVDWIRPDGTRSASGKLPFEWKRLTDADKQRIVDSTRTAIDSLDALAEAIEEQLKPWKDSVTKAARAAGARMVNTELAHPGPPVRIWPYEIVPLSEMADYYPPIRPGAAKPDADGNLWILPRTTSLSRQGELVYDVVNPTHGLAQRVRLPAGRSIAGFGKGGVVFLQSGDLKKGFIIERTTLATPIPR